MSEQKSLLSYSYIEVPGLNNDRFTGYLNEVEGITVQAGSIEEMEQELLKCLRIKWLIENEKNYNG